MCFLVKFSVNFSRFLQKIMLDSAICGKILPRFCEFTLLGRLESVELRETLLFGKKKQKLLIRIFYFIFSLDSAILRAIRRI